MDDWHDGRRDKRGEWRPERLVRPPPVFRFPWRVGEIVRWLPSYFWPWNALFMASALIYWLAFVPAPEVMREFAWGWVLWLLGVNGALVFAWYQAWEWPLYVRRRQGTRFKYNGRFPADRRSTAFWFRNQTIDNMLHTMLFGVPVWTGLQAVMLWAFANGHVPWLGFAEHPLWLAVLVALVPIIHNIHFYLIHRLLHVPFLYRHVHALHHRAFNPSPWSSLSMHPVEHLLYFSTVFWHFVIPSNPVVALYQIHFAGFGAVPGHIGFDKVELPGGRVMDTDDYMHYLHHKYFEVNYCGNIVPVDWLFGTHHDGSAEAHERMKARMRARRQRLFVSAAE